MLQFNQKMMQQVRDTATSLQNLTLQQILEQTDLSIQKLFLIRNIHDKIKPNIKTFINYCKNKQAFTYRLITSGIKSPTHGSSHGQNKIISFVSSSILTCDHQSLADLFILNLNNQIPCLPQSEDEEQIMEEIETQKIQEEVACILTNKYTYLINLFDYINHETLNENSLNYLSQALQTLIHRKISQFLQFFYHYPETLRTLIKISHYPAVAHLLAKLVVNDSEILSDIAVWEKKKIISLLLQKIHREIDQVRTYELFQSIDQILQASRPNLLEKQQKQERSLLQKLSDVIVSKGQILFHTNIIKDSLNKENKSPEILYSLNNSIAYLTIILTRLLLDQQHLDENNFKSYEPKLFYQLDQLFLSFSSVFNLYHHITQFKKGQSFLRSLMPVKFMEMLVLMTKHSRFGLFYRQISYENRIFSIKLLIDIFTMKKTGGILLNFTSCVLQKFLIQQEQTAQNNKEFRCITPPQLLRIVEQKAIIIDDIATTLRKESTKQRNKDQNSVFYHKFLVMLDNYFRSEGLQRQLDQKSHYSQLFSSFSSYNHKYSQTVPVDSHFSKDQVNQQQFGFIRKNINGIKQQNTPLNPIPKISKNIILKLTIKSKKAKDKVLSQRVISENENGSPNHTYSIEPLISETSSHTLSIQPLISEPSSNTPIIEPLILESPNHTSHIEPLILESPDHTTRIEPLIPESPNHMPRIQTLISESPDSADFKLSPRLSKAAELALQFFIRHFNIF